MKSATVPIVYKSVPTDGPLIKKSRAYKNIKDADVTLFGGPIGATMAYVGSALTSILLIVLDAVFLGGSTAEGVVSNTTATYVSIEGGQNGTLSAIVITLLIMDVLVLLTQAIDLFAFHFRVWPLTTITWFGQLFGLGLASSLLGTVSYYPFADTAQRDLHVVLAVVNLGVHAIFTAAQFSVTLEYLMRRVSKE